MIKETTFHHTEWHSTTINVCQLHRTHQWVACSPWLENPPIKNLAVPILISLTSYPIGIKGTFSRSKVTVNFHLIPRLRMCNALIHLQICLFYVVIFTRLFRILIKWGLSPNCFQGTEDFILLIMQPEVTSTVMLALLFCEFWTVFTALGSVVALRCCTVLLRPWSMQFGDGYCSRLNKKWKMIFIKYFTLRTLWWDRY